MAIEAVAEIGEAEQQAHRIAAVEGALAQRLQAFGIVWPAIAQMVAEHALQFGKAGKAEGLSEADQGRGLDLGALGDAGGRSERDLVGVVEREGGGLPQPFGQFGLDFDEAALESLEVLGCVHDDLARKIRLI